MAIARNAGSSKYISEDGEYLVTVDRIEMKKTKAGKIDPKTGLEKLQKPMLVVHFHTSEEQEIAGYFVKDLNFHMSALGMLKAACGLAPEKTSEELVGKRCGILVEMGQPSEQGRAFAGIVGYGPADQVGNRHPGETHPMPDGGSEIPF